MEEQHILKHWILPEQDLNKGTRYEQAPPVNSPLQQDCAYRRIWDPNLQYKHTLSWEAGVPSSKRIVKDMMRIPQYSIIKHFNARGCVVPGCGTRRDHHDEGMDEVGERGGH
eukprot:824986-Ditylum_brightwellii.AAC.1